MSWIDVGHGVQISLLHDTDDGRPLFAVERHDCVGGVARAQYLPLEDVGSPVFTAVWRLLSAQPMTLSPAITCGTCGMAVRVTAGRAEPVLTDTSFDGSAGPQ